MWLPPIIRKEYEQWLLFQQRYDEARAAGLYDLKAHAYACDLREVLPSASEGMAGANEDAGAVGEDEVAGNTRGDDAGPSGADDGKWPPDGY